MKKKFAVILLCMVMVVSTMAGCGSTSAPTESTSTGTAPQASQAPEGSVAQGDMVTLSLFIPGLAPFTDEATAQVEAAMNEHLAANYGFQVDLRNIEIGNFEQTMNLAMTTPELDVTCYFPSNGKLSSYAANNQLLDITDMFNHAPAEFKDLFSEAEMAVSSVNGRIFGTVRKYQFGGSQVALMNADIVAEMGIDPASITDYDSLEKVLYQVKEAHPEITVLVPQSSKEMSWFKPWLDGIGTSNAFKTETTDSTELKSLFELDRFKEFTSYAYKWYQDGLIMGDVLSNTMEGGLLVSQGAAFATLHNVDIVPLNTIYPNTVESPFLFEPTAMTSDIGNIQYGISANSAHPQESFELLKAVYMDEKLVTLLGYGIEGVHYVLNADGRAEYPEGLNGDNHPYGGFVNPAIYPNYLLLPLKANSPLTDVKKTVNDWNNSVKVAKTAGFFFDMGPYTDFTAAYNNLQDKYMYAIWCGSVSLEEVLPAIQSELTAIGYYELKDKAQAELDAWLAAQ